MLPTAVPRVDDALITLAIMLALVLGKGIGISLFAWLGLKMGLVRLPSSVCFSQIVGVGFLAGVGFTMSLFISVLAFEGQAELIEQAKLGILLGSLIASILGVFILLFSSKN
ncbi:MAG: NhaA family Na+:H+ antiporter [Gammaproteobacteria bacterium]|jgi:NhaA family Na+:H+ antiporter